MKKWLSWYNVKPQLVEHGIEALYFTINIDAPKETVWNTMLGEDTSRAWTELFDSGSYFVGDWNEGSKLLYLTPDEPGEMGAW